MLDSTVILQDVEELLTDHFGQLQATWQTQAARERQSPIITPPPPAKPLMAPAANPITDLVASVFVLFLVSVLEERFAR
ncbi:MAG: hypothetical protein R2932_12355 [Caldilineaceae bacterium]